MRPWITPHPVHGVSCNPWVRNSGSSRLGDRAATWQISRNAISQAMTLKKGVGIGWLARTAADFPPAVTDSGSRLRIEDCPDVPTTA